MRINGEMVYLWRAVDHEGEILESYVTKTRGKAAALRFMKRTLKRHGIVETITTDALRSYIPLRRCRHAHDPQVGAISVSFETDS